MFNDYRTDYIKAFFYPEKAFFVPYSLLIPLL